MEAIKEWHLENGFDDIGYHYVVTKTRGVETGRDINKFGAHARNYNRNYIGVCLTGRSMYTHDQFETTAQLCRTLMQTFGIPLKNIIPHNEVNLDKTCPNFDIKAILYPRIKELQLYETHEQ